MVKVAFWFDAPLQYTGGLNYIKNLLHALSLVNDGSVQPYVFFTHDVPDDIARQFERLACVVRTRLLQRRTLPWFTHKVLYKKFDSMAMANALMRSHGIDVVSHAWFHYKGRPPFKVISWIPDFQYLHLPELFPTINPAAETRKYQDVIRKSDVVVLSSNDAFEDFRRIAPPGHESRVAVLRFVSQPSQSATASTLTLQAMEQKHGFKGRYFLLPNQFWAHKNHTVVLEAVRLLQEKGVPVQVLCTGNTVDYRVGGTPYIDGLRAFMARHGLDGQVKILGLIDYADVLCLMRHCVAVLNPSRFEGWSSSVEEAKSMGKPVVLSRIGVHVEQAPAQGHYFDPDDAAGLADILGRLWEKTNDVSQVDLENAATAALRERTLAFGRNYLQILKDVADGRKALARPALGTGG
ncbi:glycosyltransferase family 4 protein [Azohydromonas lata]|uniref:Glycosyltransferase family 1 protein n=1 Tax=Azohydromonas lata TaxID=45677 RepID=A0ABU5IBQ1_9BURK|nr:glycosyltransferase family 1 protein [Azohydromonas lata]MDZ5456527.1 glycosyltransferase family 1 protein [Azohydromonas lata]